jgi:dienelactone hydrolase
VHTRPGVTERVLLLVPAHAKAAAILFAGGQGYVGVRDDGTIATPGNFLVRTRETFAREGIAVAILDVPSDRRAPPHLGAFRQTAQHVADVRAVIAWLRGETHLRVWLIGTSRGTQSVAYAATQLPPAAADAGGPDGIVLTSTILTGSNAHDRAVPDMPLARIAVPVLIVHHRADACALCPPAAVPSLVARLRGATRTEAMLVDGGTATGDACEAFAHHGFNGIEDSVVHAIAAWITQAAG